MKKSALLIVFVFVLTMSAFADGEIPIGGKNCPNGQTCLVAPIESKTVNRTIYQEILEFLKSIF